ncbi:hypothetical protein [Sporosarcina sp. G11-34]|uniref:hypothetical protein n=1 Tax=Sporosarcina sp. G11-34 TaxID=2849605 RepID=UPI0022A9986C|nr:hypothetical protein [Sporosarcina sp. G11-34]MCZ2256949.1 hypothetical protein [Sporosarcina sp. G11-34]
MMKKAKMTLLSIAVVGLLVAFSGGATYSWFTSQTTAVGEMQNGALELNNGQDIEMSIFEGGKFTPSQLEYGNWMTISNTGDLDTYLKATYNHSVDKASLEEYEVGYMAMKYTVQPGQDTMEQAEIELANLFNGTTNERPQSVNLSGDVEVFGGMLTNGTVSLMNVDNGEITIGEGSDEDSFWKLDEGQYIDIMFGLKLDESAGNEYQGAIYNATLTVDGKQIDEGAEFAK